MFFVFLGVGWFLGCVGLVGSWEVFVVVLDVGVVDGVTVYTLVEDYSGYDTVFLGQHGVSFLIEVFCDGDRTGILFDVGQSLEPISYNMELLGLEPEDIDLIFLSHCHFDHTGGLREMLERIPGDDIPVIGHPSIFRPHFVKEKEPSRRDIGLPYGRRELEDAGAAFKLSKSPFEVVTGVCSTGEITDRYGFEEQDSTNFYTRRDGEVVEDWMMDDMSLAINLQDGVIVVSGCSHAGIASITRKTQRITNKTKTKAIIGGFHLINSNKQKIQKTNKKLQKLNTKQLHTGHCTGLQAECQFKKQWKQNFNKLHAGKKLKLKLKPK
ncbi:MAG: Metal-dependent hydrolase of the beta-lactamase superfamily II [Candidatus Methanohalarchaeum thermophilum]|uniref:Metal-dependent hydrolase of the beta-lactamase superfamily II n=1 Tax=Methanohalarchaeum thermophilum TaxID=1903181 RepID=A0A1Q6DSU8_METT1|nr:MAG: Metal-dependent hydrolase of the beta-lactamase superfamily II [Candidatus Methanohalarchaeum thermophilum]